MEDGKVEIEFSEEELSPDYKPEEHVDGGNNDEENKETKPSSQDGAGTKSENIQQGDDTQVPENGTNATGTEEGIEVAPAQTDAELAAIYGVTESDIKYAKNMGWSTKDKFKGDPNDWKDPKKFIDIAEQSAPVLRDRMREMSKKITAMQEAFPTILEMQKKELQSKVESLTETNARLQEELEDAHMLADSKKAAELAEKITENKIKKAIVEEQIKHVGEKDGLKQAAENEMFPNVDIEKERAWRDSVYPRLTLEQRGVYNEAVRFIMNPANADQTTDQRIAYIESKVFGRRATPAAAPVARPSTVGASTAASSQKGSEYEVWDNMSQEDNDVAVSIIKETDWYKNKDSDPKAKAKWNEFKKSFRN